MLTEKISEALKKRVKMMRVKKECTQCGMEIPVYPGPYPTECPQCGASFAEKKEIMMDDDEKLTPWQQFTQFNPQFITIEENSTEDALASLKAIIGALEKGDQKGDSADMLKMGKGILDYYEKNKSFAPKQAEWIYNTSKALFK